MCEKKLLASDAAGNDRVCERGKVLIRGRYVDARIVTRPMGGREAVDLRITRVLVV